MSNIVMFIFLSLYFWIGALWQGYFAETAYLSSNLVLFAGLLVLICRKRELVFSRIHVFVFLFVAAYWISVVYAVDVEQAVLEASRVTGLLPLSLMIQLVPDDQLKRLYKVWPWIGAMLTVAGVLLEMERNGRLESTIEYANALAIFLLVNIGISLLAYLQERRIVHLTLMTANAVGLLLTFSRSVWVLWLVMIIASVILFPELRKRPTWLYVGVVHLTSMIIALLIKGDGFFFWQRVSSIQSKTSEFQIRLVYWKDALKMLRVHGVAGTGGGGWNVLLPFYRSQDYFVRYVHNHFIQIALDIGMFGILVFLGWLGVFYWTSIKKLKMPKDEGFLWLKGAVLLVSVMALHAGFDFDLTFPFIFSVLLCLTVPMDSKTFKWRLPSPKIAIVAPVLLALIGWWGWLAVGYGYSQAADYQVRASDHSEAQSLFSRAEHMLPWSSTVLYGSAKEYVRQGNETGDHSYYEMARKKLVMASEKVPDQTLYQELLNQIPQN